MWFPGITSSPQDASGTLFGSCTKRVWHPDLEPNRRYLREIHFHGLDVIQGSGLHSALVAVSNTLLLIAYPWGGRKNSHQYFIVWFSRSWQLITQWKLILKNSVQLCWKFATKSQKLALTLKSQGLPLEGFQGTAKLWLLPTGSEKESNPPSSPASWHNGQTKKTEESTSWR